MTELYSREPEPIAIVGMECRFPGAKNRDEYWQLLHDGVDAVTEVPEDRWDVDAFYDPDPAAPGKMNTRHGGFVENLEAFDAYFFGMSPRQAAPLDPRQRLMLEVTWEALEDAGIPPDSLAGSRTGVYVATLRDDYDRLLFADLTRADAYSGTGTAHTMVANRISYVFDLRGPSMAVDTACSGALVAVHLACQSLRTGESELALAGGVHVNLLPDANVFFSKAGALASDGRCKTFDARADGIVRSDGAGVAVLKPLHRALDDGDPIYAVIRGSAVNQDGRSEGIMAPNRQAQEMLLRDAYERTTISPHQVQYVEAHGTGTGLGDPIEVQALGAVLADGRPEHHPCALGSVKTNLGHMEPAAGIAGLIKVALMIKHRRLVPSLHFENPNPRIPWQELPLEVQQSTGPWPNDSDPLIAGINAFGFGGTNAHIIVSEAPQQPARPTTPARTPYMLPLSARTADALLEMAERYHEYLKTSDETLHDVCYTAGARRSHHEERLAVVAKTREDMVACLDAHLAGEPVSGVTRDQVVPGHNNGRLAFVFGGEGTQWTGVGADLLEHEPIFRAKVEQCDHLLRRHVDWSLVTHITASEKETQFRETDIAQPAVFAIQVGLAAMWQSWGIVPDAVVGQGLGEIAAAHVAGALSLVDAISIVYHRSRLMARTAGTSATVAVDLPPTQAKLLLTGFEQNLRVVGSSSPNTSVISGDPTILDRIITSLERQDISCRRLADTGPGFHSPEMDTLCADLEAALTDIAPRPAHVPIVSSLTTQRIEGEQLDARYWAKHVSEPFHFADAMTHLIENGHSTFLEISPNGRLQDALRAALQYHDRDGVILSSMQRGTDGRVAMLQALATLYAGGRAVDWTGLYPDGGRVVQLPRYPWQRERYWFDQLNGAGQQDRGSNSGGTE